MKAANAKATNAFLFKFKEDTDFTVSRDSIQNMAKRLGFNETQLVHVALARFRDYLAEHKKKALDFGNEDDYPPLTEEQLAAIRKHRPKRLGKPVASESLF